MADEKLVEEVARVLAGRVCYGVEGIVEVLLSSPALIKRMAEGVGLEVTEKLERFYVENGEDNVYLKDRDQASTVSWFAKRYDPELARQRLQERADELNRKERG